MWIVDDELNCTCEYYVSYNQAVVAFREELVCCAKNNVENIIKIIDNYCEEFYYNDVPETICWLKNIVYNILIDPNYSMENKSVRKDFFWEDDNITISFYKNVIHVEPKHIYDENIKEFKFIFAEIAVPSIRCPEECGYVYIDDTQVGNIINLDLLPCWTVRYYLSKESYFNDVPDYKEYFNCSYKQAKNWAKKEAKNRKALFYNIKDRTKEDD